VARCVTARSPVATAFLGGHDEDQCGRCSRCRIYNRRRPRSHEQGVQDESSPLVCSDVLREEWEGAKPWWTDASARATRCARRLGSGFLTPAFAIEKTPRYSRGPSALLARFPIVWCVDHHRRMGGAYQRRMPTSVVETRCNQPRSSFERHRRVVSPTPFRLCIVLALLHEATLGSSAERFPVAANCLWLT
jgi:hypothetical protein